MDLWDLEPDEMKFKERGKSCLIERHKSGHLNGYIFLDAPHIFVGMDEDEVSIIIGGRPEITFSGRKMGKWAIGFSFSHSEHFVPKVDNCSEEFQELKNLEDYLGLVQPEKKYGTLEMVVERVREVLTKMEKVTSSSSL